MLIVAADLFFNTIKEVWKSKKHYHKLNKKNRKTKTLIQMSSIRKNQRTHIRKMYWHKDKALSIVQLDALIKKNGYRKRIDAKWNVEDFINEFELEKLIKQDANGNFKVSQTGIKYMEEREESKEEKTRVRNRWIIGTVIAVLGLIVAYLSFVQ